mmetsp:Transcript_52602/g.163330  ORF Transcript_52602/g.163330 Transcript_52602/m.163330 type:complete len:266 (+) Transcript_52602:590-1387(+)
MAAHRAALWSSFQGWLHTACSAARPTSAAAGPGSLLGAVEAVVSESPGQLALGSATCSPNISGTSSEGFNPAGGSGGGLGLMSPCEHGGPGARSSGISNTPSGGGRGLPALGCGESRRSSKASGPRTGSAGRSPCGPHRGHELLPLLPPSCSEPPASAPHSGALFQPPERHRRLELAWRASSRAPESAPLIIPAGSRPAARCCCRPSSGRASSSAAASSRFPVREFRAIPGGAGRGRLGCRRPDGGEASSRALASTSRNALLGCC